MELMENSNLRLFAANRKKGSDRLPLVTANKHENGSLFSLVSLLTVINDCYVSKLAHLHMVSINLFRLAQSQASGREGLYCYCRKPCVVPELNFQQIIAK
jgi:hypothetical protein